MLDKYVPPNKQQHIGLIFYHWVTTNYGFIYENSLLVNNKKTILDQYCKYIIEPTLENDIDPILTNNIEPILLSDIESCDSKIHRKRKLENFPRRNIVTFEPLVRTFQI